MNEQKSVAVAAVAAVTLIYEFQNFQVSDWPNQENPILFDQFCNFDANFHRINNTFVRNWYVFGHVVFFSLCFLCVIHPFPIHVPWCLIVCGQLIFQIEKVWNCCFFFTDEVDWNVDGALHTDSACFDPKPIVIIFVVAWHVYGRGKKENQTIEFLSIVAKPITNESSLHRFIHVRTGSN